MKFTWTYIWYISVIFWLTITWVSAANANYGTNLEAANFLAQKNVIVDYSNNVDFYNLENKITRREMLKVMMNISGVDVPQSCVWKFEDLRANDYWCKYAEKALSLWYIAENENFRPDDFISEAESLKMIMQAKNIERNESTNWQYGYSTKALEVGIIDENINYSDSKALRGWIFQTAARTYNAYWIAKAQDRAHIITESGQCYILDKNWKNLYLSDETQNYSIEYRNENANASADINTESLLGTWTRTSYPYGTLEFTENQLKNNEWEWLLEPATFEDYSISVDCTPEITTQDISNKNDIISALSDYSQFSILAEALWVAGDIELLKWTGSFTLFAPSNDAFRDLPEGELERLLQVENKDELTTILTNHFVAGKYTADTLSQWLILTNVLDNQIQISKVGVNTFLNTNAELNVLDVEYSNGILQEINTVLFPEIDSKDSYTYELWDITAYSEKNWNIEQETGRSLENIYIRSNNLSQTFFIDEDLAFYPMADDFYSIYEMPEDTIYAFNTYYSWSWYYYYVVISWNTLQVFRALKEERYTQNQSSQWYDYSLFKEFQL